MLVYGSTNELDNDFLASLEEPGAFDFGLLIEWFTGSPPNVTQMPFQLNFSTKQTRYVRAFYYFVFYLFINSSVLRGRAA